MNGIASKQSTVDKTKEEAKINNSSNSDSLSDESPESVSSIEDSPILLRRC